MRAQPQTQSTKPSSSLKPVSTTPALRSSPRKHATKAAEVKLAIAQAKSVDRQKTNKAGSGSLRCSPQKNSRTSAPSFLEPSSSTPRKLRGAVPTKASSRPAPAKAAPRSSRAQDETLQQHFPQSIDELGVGGVGIREFTPIPDDPDPLRTAIEEAQFNFGNARQSSLEVDDEMKVDDLDVCWEARYGPKGRLEAGTNGWDFYER